MIKVLLAGYAPLEIRQEIMGTAIFSTLSRYIDSCVYLRRGLTQDPEIEVDHIPPHLAFEDFPRSMDELSSYDVLLLTDIDKDTLVLYPDLMKVPMGPNRLKLIVDYVARGGGLIYAGGWQTFQGYHGIGGWYGTPVAEILPVEIRPVYDDRVETPEGVAPKAVKQDHPIMQGIPWGTCPMFTGHNKVGKVKEGATLLAEIDNDPLIAVWEHKEGKVMIFASSPGPHWGTAFVEWQYYPKFWIQTVKWLTKKKTHSE
jgi:uncharacterized membrane protein